MNELSNFVRIPCEVEGFYTARHVLRDPNATAEQIAAACDVLAASNDWFDIRMVSNARNLLWSVPGSEIRQGDNFRRLDEVEIAGLGLRREVKTIPHDVPDFAFEEEGPDMRVLLVATLVVTVVALGIGRAAQWLWGAV